MNIFIFFGFSVDHSAYWYNIVFHFKLNIHGSERKLSHSDKSSIPIYHADITWYIQIKNQSPHCNINV